MDPLMETGRAGSISPWVCDCWLAGKGSRGWSAEPTDLERQWSYVFKMEIRGVLFPCLHFCALGTFTSK